MADAGTFVDRAREGLDRAARAWLAPARTWQAIVEAPTLPVGTTPKELVWQLHDVKLYRYVPRRPAAERHPTPLLLVYAIINRPFIFDLQPGRSFVEHLLDDGFDVWLVDWGEPGPGDEETTFDDYAADYLPRAVRRVLQHSGADELDVLGYCVGSAIALSWAALFPEAPLRRLVVLTPPVDQGVPDGSLFNLWLDPRWFDVDRVAELLGNVPTEMIETSSKLLKAVANYVGAYRALHDRVKAGDDEGVRNWQALQRWVQDGVPIARDAFRQWVRDYMWGNALVTGEHLVQGRRLDLRNVRVPVLSVVAKYDHIVPASQSAALPHLLGSDDVTVEVVRAGHVGLMAGGGAKHHVWPVISGWLASDR